MADANWLRKAPPVADSNEDPFAELTRIMGFDPRVPFRGGPQPAAAPVVQATPQQVTAPNVDLSDDDLDLSIDLERELMGALEPEAEEPAFAEAAPRAPLGAAGFEQSAFDERDQPSLDEQAYGAAWPAEHVGSEDRDFAGADSGAFAEYGVADEPAAYEDPSAPAESRRDPAAVEEFDAGYGRDASYADGMPAADAYADDDQAVDLAAHLDQQLVASFEEDLTDDQDYWQGEAAYGGEDAYAAEQPAALAQADDFAEDFDAAMAEVDMDFTAAPVATAEQALDHAAHQAVRAELEDELGSAFDDGLDVQPSESVGGYEAQPEAFAAGGAGWSDDDVPVREPVFTAQAFVPEADDEPAVEVQPQEDAAQSEIDDAIAELAAMVRGYDRPQPTAAASSDTPEVIAPARPVVDTPEIDTVDVPEDAVALADDLDLPDVDYPEDAAPQFDDLDAELAAAFGEPAIETVQPAPVEARAAAQEFDLGGGYDMAEAQDAAFRATPYAVAAGAGAAAAVHYAQGAARGGDFQVVRRPSGQDDDYDFDVDSEFDDALASEPAQPKPSLRRGLVIASIVGGIAVVGAIGAFAFSGGDGIGSGEPALVKADADPIKVRPENPGGATIPNQESQVFDRAAGAAPAAPDQQQLISSEEEPVDVAARFPDSMPEPMDESADMNEPADVAAKDEDRIDQVIAEDQARPVAQETIAVAPRKVRTMVVKSDGTLVPREEVAGEPETVGSTTAAGSLTDPAISAPQGVAPAAELAPAGGAQPADVPAAAEQPAAAAQQPAVAETPRAAASDMPDRVPVAPSRPADQPLDIVGEVKPDQVAAIQPAAAAPAAGSWSMQIASQPSEAAAQSSYRDLARRYASVLDGRSASIVKADIAGKGTFWRVRVPAGSRNEAIKLCESYKAAGGNCFVSK